MAIKGFYKNQDYTPWIDYAYRNNQKGYIVDRTHSDLSDILIKLGKCDGYQFGKSQVGIPEESSYVPFLWGYNNSGQLGDNTIISKSSPVSVVGGHSFKQFSSAPGCTLFLKADGTCWSVGYNYVSSSSSPVSVLGNHSFVKITSCSSHWWGLKLDGTSWGWGYNYYGTLGMGTTLPYTTPTLLSGHSWIDITLGGTDITQCHTLGLKSDGSVWASGRNFYGQLGDNTTANKSYPTSVYGNHSFTQIAAGENTSCGLKSDGSVFMWGSGPSGPYTKTPTSLSGGHQFIQISVGGGFGIGLKNDGTAWAFGWMNGYGQHGNGSIVASGGTPASVLGNHSFIQIVCNVESSMGIKSDGSVWTWGRNQYGQLGILCTMDRSVPTMSGTPYSINISSLANNINGAVGGCIKSDNTTFVWGPNASSNLGDNSITSKSYLISSVYNLSVNQIAMSAAVGLALKTDGTCWYWGTGLSGGTSTPKSVVGEYTFSKIYTGGDNSAFGIRSSDNTGWAWGTNTYGWLGDNTVTTRTSPISIVGENQFLMIAPSTTGGYFTLFLRTDGTCWATGSNSYGWLGDNTVTTRSSPVSVVGGNIFSDISAGCYHSMALRSSDGIVFCWGYNAYGQLGDNTTVNKSSPISIVGNHSFTNIYAGAGFSAGLKSDGSVWTWGYNNNGQLGDNTTVNKSSPVSVVGGHSFISIRCGTDNVGTGMTGYILALKSDGRIWSWGLNNYGQLAIAGTNNTSSPCLSLYFPS